MKLTLKPVAEQVIVITGASSGIGLTTAKMAAERGAQVVLAARCGQALREIVDQIQVAGGRAIAVEADVSKSEEITRLADCAVAEFGRIDTWVNNAGTSIFGKLRDVPEEDHRKLFDTNFWGTVYGSLTAVDHLSGRGGAIINLGSVASDMSLPLQGMYSATKYAVKAFTNALRMELESEGIPISLTLIKPTSINTPFPQRAKNYMEQEPKLPDPVYAPEEVAHAILYAAENRCRDLNVGGAGKAMTVLSNWAPRLMDLFSERIMMPMQKRDEPPRHPHGSLERPYLDGEGHGEHPNPVLSKCLYSRAIMNPLAAGATLASAGLLTAMLVGNFRRQR